MLEIVNSAFSAFFSRFKPSRTDITSPNYLTRYDLNQLYKSGFPAQRVIDLIPEDCLLQDPEWNFGEDSKIESKDFETALENIVVYSEPFMETDITGAFELAMKYGRKTGDGFIFLGIDDGLDPRLPVNVNNIKSVDYVIVRDRYHVALNTLTNTVKCYKQGYTTQDIEGENPELLSQQDYHMSRVLRFSGIRTVGDNYGGCNSYFNESILSNVFNSYKNYLRSLSSSGDMLASHSVFSYAMKGLNKFAQSSKNSTSAINKRFTTLMEGLNLFGGAIYDADTEKVEYLNRSYTGVKDLLDHLQEWLIASSGMPRSKIFGNAPLGAMSEGSKGEKDNWNEIIARYQNLHLRKEQIKLAKYLLRSLGEDNPFVQIKYPLYYPLTQKEKADIASTNSQTDERYVKNGIITRDEVRQSRFANNAYGDVITIDPDLQADNELQAEDTSQEEDPFDDATDPEIEDQDQDNENDS